MRRRHFYLGIALGLLTLGTAAVATAARPGPVEDGTLSVRDGRATLQLRLKGGVIGRFGTGKLTITAGESSSVVVRGGRITSANGRTTVYQGRSIRFRIADDKRVTVRINASKINFSAVGRGDGWLDGWGNRERGVYFDGSFSLNGEAYKSLPDEREAIELASVPTEQ